MAMVIKRNFALCDIAAGAPFGMPGPFDPAAAAAMAGAYQLGGMPGGDPYAAAAFGMQAQPDAAMFQAYQQANGAALASLMRPNGMGPGGPAPTGGPGPAQGGSTSSSGNNPPSGGSAGGGPQMNGKPAPSQPSEVDGIATVNSMGKNSG
jgi:hypothetical protein